MIFNARIYDLEVDYKFPPSSYNGKVATFDVSFKYMGFGNFLSSCKQRIRLS